MEKAMTAFYGMTCYKIGQFLYNGGKTLCQKALQWQN